MEKNNISEGVFLKRSLSLHGHRTSLSLEQGFWAVLEIAANSQEIPLGKFKLTSDSNIMGRGTNIYNSYVTNLMDICIKYN